MKNYIFIILILGTICSDHRRPSKYTKNCFINALGEEKTKALLSSFRKYHRTNGKAKFSDFIIAKRPELKETLEKCLEKKRTLNGEDNEGEKIIVSDKFKEMKEALKKGNIKEALNKCKLLRLNERFCQRLIIKYNKEYLQQNK